MVENKEHTFFLYQAEKIYQKAATRYKYYVRSAGEGPNHYIKVNNDREVLFDLLYDSVHELYRELLLRHSKGIETPVYIGLVPQREDIQLQYETNLYTSDTRYLLSTVDTDLTSLLVMKLMYKWAELNNSATASIIAVDLQHKISETKSIVLSLRTRTINHNPIY